MVRIACRLGVEESWQRAKARILQATRAIQPGMMQMEDFWKLGARYQLFLPPRAATCSRLLARQTGFWQHGSVACNPRRRAEHAAKNLSRAISRRALARRTASQRLVLLTASVSPWQRHRHPRHAFCRFSAQARPAGPPTTPGRRATGF